MTLEEHILRLMPSDGATSRRMHDILTGFLISCTPDEVTTALILGAKTRRWRVDYSSLPPVYFPKKEG